MRAVTCFLLAFSLAAAGVVFSDHPSAAQTKPSDEAKPAQTLTGPGGSDKPASPAAGATPAEPKAAESKATESKTGPAGRDAPKQAQDKATQDKAAQEKSAKDDKAANGKKPAAGRVGTLSPGEARRAARARDRAASARRDRSPQKATPAAPADPAVTTKEVSPSEKSAKVTQQPSGRPAETAKRRTASERTSRPTRERASASPPRRGYAGADRYPRAGDVVPRGYPLYPMPPRGTGYYEVDGGPPRRYGPAYPPPPRGYPAFPRVHFGFDDPDDD